MGRSPNPSEDLPLKSESPDEQQPPTIKPSKRWVFILVSITGITVILGLGLGLGSDRTSRRGMGQSVMEETANTMVIVYLTSLCVFIQREFERLVFNTHDMVHLKVQLDAGQKAMGNAHANDTRFPLVLNVHGVVVVRQCTQTILA